MMQQFRDSEQFFQAIGDLFLGMMMVYGGFVFSYIVYKVSSKILKDIIRNTKKLQQNS